MKSIYHSTSKNAWIESNRDEFVRQDVEQWQSERAPGEARSAVADEFNQITDWHGTEQEHWARQAVQEYIDERAKDGLSRVPYTTEQILSSMYLETDNNNLDNWSFRRADAKNLVTFNDAELAKPDTKIIGQKTLPGIAE